MSDSDLAVVKGIYAAFDRGDIEAVLGTMAPDIEWREADHNKLADRNPYIGPQAVLEGVFARLMEDFEDFTVEAERFVASDGQVAMRGRYRGVAKATGNALNPQIVHWWTLREGKVAAFQQYVDTLALARAYGEV